MWLFAPSCLFSQNSIMVWCQLPEAPTLGWRDESLMASDFNIRVQYLHFVIICDRIWDRGVSGFFQHTLLNVCYSCLKVCAVHTKLKNDFLLQVTPFRKFYHICMHDVGCLKLPPSGGVTSRWWLLILTLEFNNICILSTLIIYLYASLSLLMSVAWSSHPRVAWRVADCFWFQCWSSIFAFCLLVIGFEIGA